jgi:hypothetical protein
MKKGMGWFKGASSTQPQGALASVPSYDVTTIVFPIIKINKYF